MARITIKNITKKFGEKTALNNVSLTVEDGEFLVLFGPAGAGKTTLLNMIAGIDDPDEGCVWFNEKAMNYIESRNRNVSMVFENYALYPQMSVYDNIASPLRSKMHKKTEEEIKKQVDRVARITGMENYLERKPSQLSNGQRQRVALSRALVREPNVFLLDEPIAHLDAKLRNAMRKELKLMQKNLACTSIYVTHDFTEAMSLSDRIAVLCEGEIVQVGTNVEVYYTPINEFVAKMFGECEINLIPATIQVGTDGWVAVTEWSGEGIPIPRDVESKLQVGQEVDLGIRTPGIIYSRVPAKGLKEGFVYSIEPLGNKTELIVQINENIIRFIIPVNEKFDIDEKIYLGLDPTNIIFFDKATEKYIGRHNAEELLEV